MQKNGLWKRVRGLLAIVLSVAMVVETPSLVSYASYTIGADKYYVYGGGGANRAGFSDDDGAFIYGNYKGIAYSDSGDSITYIFLDENGNELKKGTFNGNVDNEVVQDITLEGVANGTEFLCSKVDSALGKTYTFTPRRTQVIAGGNAVSEIMVEPDKTATLRNASDQAVTIRLYYSKDFYEKSPNDTDGYLEQALETGETKSVDLSEIGAWTTDKTRYVKVREENGVQYYYPTPYVSIDISNISNQAVGFSRDGSNYDFSGFYSETVNFGDTVYFKLADGWRIPAGGWSLSWVQQDEQYNWEVKANLDSYGVLENATETTVAVNTAKIPLGEWDINKRLRLNAGNSSQVETIVDGVAQWITYDSETEKLNLSTPDSSFQWYAKKTYAPDSTFYYMSTGYNDVVTEPYTYERRFKLVDKSFGINNLDNYYADTTKFTVTLAGSMPLKQLLVNGKLPTNTFAYTQDKMGGTYTVAKEDYVEGVGIILQPVYDNINPYYVVAAEDDSLIEKQIVANAGDSFTLLNYRVTEDISYQFGEGDSPTLLPASVMASQPLTVPQVSQAGNVWVYDYDEEYPHRIMFKESANIPITVEDGTVTALNGTSITESSSTTAVLGSTVSIKANEGVTYEPSVLLKADGDFFYAPEDYQPNTNGAEYTFTLPATGYTAAKVVFYPKYSMEQLEANKNTVCYAGGKSIIVKKASSDSLVPTFGTTSQTAISQATLGGVITAPSDADSWVFTGKEVASTTYELKFQKAYTIKSIDYGIVSIDDVSMGDEGTFYAAKDDKISLQIKEGALTDTIGFIKWEVHPLDSDDAMVTVYAPNAATEADLTQQETSFLMPEQDISIEMVEGMKHTISVPMGASLYQKIGDTYTQVTTPESAKYVAGTQLKVVTTVATSAKYVWGIKRAGETETDSTYNYPDTNEFAFEMPDYDANVIVSKTYQVHLDTAGLTDAADVMQGIHFVGKTVSDEDRTAYYAPGETVFVEVDNIPGFICDAPSGMTSGDTGITMNSVAGTTNQFKFTMPEDGALVTITYVEAVTLTLDGTEYVLKKGVSTVVGLKNVPTDGRVLIGWKILSEVEDVKASEKIDWITPMGSVQGVENPYSFTLSEDISVEPIYGYTMNFDDTNKGNEYSSDTWIKAHNSTGGSGGYIFYDIDETVVDKLDANGQTPIGAGEDGMIHCPQVLVDDEPVSVSWLYDGVSVDKHLVFKRVAPKYAVTLVNAKIVSSEATEFAAGETIQVEVDLPVDKRFEVWTITSVDGETLNIPISLVPNTTNVYEFTMPAHEIKVNATYEQLAHVQITGGYLDPEKTKTEGYYSAMVDQNIYVYVEDDDIFEYNYVVKSLQDGEYVKDTEEVLQPAATYYALTISGKDLQIELTRKVYHKLEINQFSFDPEEEVLEGTFEEGTMARVYLGEVPTESRYYRYTAWVLQDGEYVLCTKPQVCNPAGNEVYIVIQDADMKVDITVVEAHQVTLGSGITIVDEQGEVLEGYLEEGMKLYVKCAIPEGYVRTGIMFAELLEDGSFGPAKAMASGMENDKEYVLMPKADGRITLNLTPGLWWKGLVQRVDEEGEFFDSPDLTPGEVAYFTLSEEAEGKEVDFVAETLVDGEREALEYTKTATGWSIVLPSTPVYVTGTEATLYSYSLKGVDEPVSAKYRAGTAISFEAADRPRQRFLNWLATNAAGEDITKTLLTSATEKKQTITMPAHDVVIQAVFEMEREAANYSVKVGAPVRLAKGIPYKFEAGKTWKVKGDSTSYAGGMTFYVATDAEYEFE